MFRKLSIAFLLVALACLIAGSALAQSNEGSQPQSPQAGEPPEHGWGHGHFDPAKRTEMLTKQLKLTSDQQPKVLDILKSEQSQMEKLRSDSSLSQDDRWSKMMEIRKSTNDQIRTLLDPDQQKKWDKMQSERGQWQGHHHGGQDSGAPPDSPDQK
jgi:Spy/CpxP family protein refolding chaperone